ncbi:MAG TPA: PA2169 family four-helix-bundle protein [Ilumatobacteraceae bacterium]
MPTATIATLKELIEVDEAGCQEFNDAATRLSHSGHPTLAAKFAEYSRQRAWFVSELCGLDPELQTHGHVQQPTGGPLHRRWLAMKDAFTPHDARRVIDAAQREEDQALTAYSRALVADLPPVALSVIERQYVAIRNAHDTVSSLRDQN